MEETQTDLVIVGSGAAGMTAALTASLLGLTAQVLEKAPVIGGTTALSAGSVWVPNSMHAPAGTDSVEQARTYLRATVGNRLNPALSEAFLRHGPAMVHFLADSTDVQLRAYPKHPDYLANADGATIAGRALEPMPFDGRHLGADFRRLRDPLPEFTLFGGMMVDRRDIGDLLAAARSPGSFSRTLRLIGRYGFDRIRHHRGTRLVMGNALAGRLYASLRRRDVPVRTEVAVTGLIKRDGGVVGVETHGGSGPNQIFARLGVVLATGGFSRHPTLRKQLLPEPAASFSPLAETITGDGVSCGLDAGGRLGEGHADSSFWTPVSVRKRRDGTTAVFPHFVLDRGKPGLVAVDRGGRRFVSEAIDYHRFGQAMYANQARGTIPCHFVCDHRFMRKYGLGMVRPGASNLGAALADGYVLKAATLTDLAGALEIDASGLSQEMLDHNESAASGIDRAFGKGGDAYERNLGDPTHGPNPCLGPIDTPPFYAIKVYPGDIGASVGLVTDEHARVIGADGTPIPGLYACGNDMDSIMAGVYPGPGITIGPAMTFGYIAAHHAAEIAQSLSTGCRVSGGDGLLGAAISN